MKKLSRINHNQKSLSKKRNKSLVSKHKPQKPSNIEIIFENSWIESNPQIPNYNNITSNISNMLTKAKAGSIPRNVKFVSKNHSNHISKKRFYFCYYFSCRYLKIPKFVLILFCVGIDL